MGKINYFLISFLVLSTFLFSFSSAFAASRDIIIETPTSVTIRLSQVYFKGNETSVPTYLPMLESIYSCDSIAIRTPVKEYGSSVLKGRYYLHGNRDYYLRGFPMENIKNISGKYIGLNIQPIEYLGAKNSLGKFNSYGYWWGVDTKPTCTDNNVYAPLSGQIYGDIDRSLANGGYERNIVGTGFYSGFAVKVLHLATLDKIGLKFVNLNSKDILSKVSSSYLHSHTVVMFGTGNGKADIPYANLIPPEISRSYYIEKGYIDGSTPPDASILKYIQIGNYDNTKALNGFDKTLLENSYKYFSKLTNKTVMFDIGIDKQIIVKFDQQGKFLEG